MLRHYDHISWKALFYICNFSSVSIAWHIINFGQFFFTSFKSVEIFQLSSAKILVSRPRKFLVLTVVVFYITSNHFLFVLFDYKTKLKCINFTVLFYAYFSYLKSFSLRRKITRERIYKLKIMSMSISFTKCYWNVSRKTSKQIFRGILVVIDNK